MAGIPNSVFALGRGALDRHLRNAGVSKDLREAIAALTPRDRADVLRSERVGQLVRNDPRAVVQLGRILVPPSDEAIPSAVEGLADVSSSLHQRTGLLLAVLHTAGSRRLVILDGGAEIASACFEDDGIEYSSMRIFGYRPWDMPNVPRPICARLAATLFGPLRRRLFALAGDVALVHEDALRFRLLAAVVTFTGSVAGGPPVVDSPGTLPGDAASGLAPENDCANGCGPEVDILNTLVPDGSWKRCCNDHDRCYCRGQCDTCGRLECDNAFFDCMLQRTNLPQAYVYYLFVRALGGFGSYECDEPFGLGGLALVGAGAVVGIAVGVLTRSTVAGIAAGVTTVAILSLLLCRVCEVLYRWRQEVQELLRRLISWQMFRRRARRCGRKRGFLKRLWCRAATLAGYVARWIVAILLIPGLVTLWILEKVACGA